MSQIDNVDISQITDYLFISSEPQDKDVEAIIERNIRLVISMIGNHRPPTVFAQEPLRLLWLQTYDTILTPIPISKLLQGVQIALPVIQNGKGILCYCAQGRHRSVAMGASILVGMGYSAEEAMDYLRAQRKVAHPQAWHIRRRIEQFEELWQQQNEQPIQIHQSREVYSEFVTGVVSKVLWGLGLGRKR